MRIAVLWTCLSGYLNACLKELAMRDSVELFVCYQSPQSEAPYDDRQFSWITHRLTWQSNSDLQTLDQRLSAFAPEILVFGGWHLPAYRSVARRLSGRCWRVMVTDRCWLATPRQKVGSFVAPYVIAPLADAMWVPGERQAILARKLGFGQNVILRGVYACDQPAFESIYDARIEERRPVAHSFLFIGRFVPEKSVDVLVEAYRLYRESVPDPWAIRCYGEGALRSRLENQVGIQVNGFVQPDRMPGVLADSGCLVIPSRFEPWALVVHEATSAGLLVLASEDVGAVPHLVQPGYNGFVFSSGDKSQLAHLMSRVSSLSDERLDQMSSASSLLSRQFSPARWADTLLESYDVLWRDGAKVGGPVLAS